MIRPLLTPLLNVWKYFHTFFFKKIFKQFTKKRLFIDDFILSKVYSQYRRDNEKKVINILWKDRGPRKTNTPGCLLPSKIITQKQMCDYFLFIKMCEK